MVTSTNLRGGSQLGWVSYNSCIAVALSHIFQRFGPTYRSLNFKLPEREIQVIENSTTEPSGPPNLTGLANAREELGRPGATAEKIAKHTRDVLRELCNERGINYTRKTVKLVLAQRLVRD